MRFEQHTLQSLGEEKYRDIFTQAFGEMTPHLVHDVFIGYDGEKYIAFADVVPHNPEDLYLKYIGFSSEVDPYKKFGYYKEFINHLQDLGFEYITGAIESTNTTALVYALRYGFEIRGTRTSSDNKVLVEVMRRRVYHG